MTGTEMLLKQLLKAAGVTITPEEITTEFNNIRTMVPRFAGEAKEILSRSDTRYAALELKLDLIIMNQDTAFRKLEEIDLKIPGIDGLIPAGVGEACQLSTEMAQALVLEGGKNVI